MPSFEEYRRDEKKALAEATAVARAHCDAKPVSSRLCPFQGMFSCTVIVTLSDNSEVVVQLKDNEIDTTRVVLAHALLGDVVPIVHAVKTKALFAYVSKYVPGNVWSRAAAVDIEGHLKICFQIGALIGRCTMKDNSAGIVNGYVIPRLRRIVSKERMQAKLNTRIKSLIPVAEGLKSLPLSLCHIDINQMNVIVDEKNANVAGLVDWEQAQLLPVGMNTWCIRYLSVPNRNRVDYPDTRTQTMAEAFWKGLVSTLPSHILGLLDKVVDAMAIGLVMNVFSEGFSPEEVTVNNMMERLDWIEDTFRPKCSSS